MNSAKRWPFRLIGTVTTVGVLCAWAIRSERPVRSASTDVKQSTYFTRWISLPKGGKFAGVRIKVNTGETWSLDGLKWRKLDEPEPLIQGEYELTIVDSPSDVITVRTELHTGQTWVLYDHVWKKVAEP